MPEDPCAPLLAACASVPGGAGAEARNMELVGSHALQGRSAYQPLVRWWLTVNEPVAVLAVKAQPLRVTVLMLSRAPPTTAELPVKLLF